ncbi:C4b-binding protein beta chain-like isoform X2 [Glandiceps talaboti]
MRFTRRVPALVAVIVACLYFDQVKGQCQDERAAPENGKKTYAYEVYECDNGFTLSGPGNLTYSGSTWDEEIPTCIANNCTDPGAAPQNGQISGSDYTHGSTVEYTCDAGYELSGPGVLTCKAGQWDNEVPTCNDIITTTHEQTKAPGSGSDTVSIPSKCSVLFVVMLSAMALN